MEKQDLLTQVIIRQVRLEDLKGLEWEGEYARFRQLYADAYARSEKGEAVLWVAELPGKGLIGQLFVQLNSARHDIADGSSHAYIYGFRVRPTYRRKGIGSSLIRVAENDLRKRGFRRVLLNVGQDNPGARRLYEKHGYRVVGLDPGRWFYFDQYGVRRQVHEPAWRMQKILN